MPITRAREVDPSRTILLRRQARTQLRRRFSAFKAMLRKAPQDSLEAFQAWYETALQRSGLMDETLWQHFIYAAFKKGVSRGYEDSKGRRGKAKEEFTSDALAATTKQTLLADRAFDEMENCLTDLENRLARVITTALLANDSKDKLAAIADGGEWRAEVIARTEMIRAHAEGQLHALHRLGHRVVGVMAEFHSTDDDLTCDECEALDGQIYELDAAHGVIPVHPLCRCAWLPAYEPDDDDGGMAMNRWVTLASGQHVVVGDDGAVTPRPKYGSTDQPYWHPGMNPTVDMVVTRDGDKGKEVLLIKRSKDSKAFPNQWALPGGFHDTNAKKGEPWKAGKETKREAAIRELKEETGVAAGVKVARVGVFQGPGRDPRDNSRAWSQSTAFRVHVPAGTPAKGADDAQAAKWVSVDQIGTLAFDHAKILAKAGITANEFDESKHARDAKGEFTSGPEHAGVEAITTARANEFLPRTKGMDKGKMLEEVAACLAPKGWKATIESGDNALVVTGKREDGAWSKARLERYHGEVTCKYEHLYTPLGDHGDNPMYAMASQMQHLAENGVDKLRFTAAKSAAHNGYYIWAKLGGDAPMPLVTRAKLLLHGINASTVQGLLAKPGGDKLWEKYGQECEMTLDLKHSKASKLISRMARQQVANAAGLHDWLADGPPGIVVNEFDESKHPRDHGKFAMADDNSTEDLERTLDVLSVHSHEFAEKLTPDEKSTLKEYSQSMYFYLNSQMRKCPPDYECLAPLMKAYKKDMDSAFEKAKPLPHPVEVARFVDVGKDMDAMLTGAESKLKAGGTFSMPSYTSTSLDAAHWEHNQDFGGAGKLKFAIKARTGVYMSHELSAHSQEAELLQSPKAKYKVAGVDRATNTIHLEEVLPTANYNPNHDEKGQFAADPAAKLAGKPEEKNYDKEDKTAITKLRGMQKAGDFLGAGRWFDEYDGIREARQDEVMKSLDFMKNEKPNVAGIMVTKFTGFDDNGHDRKGMTRTKDFVRNYLDPSIRLNKYEDPLRYLQTPINRAGYEGTTNYVYAQHADFHTFVHEMGHAIQSNNPRVHEAVVAFFNKRLGNEAPKNLTLIDPKLKNPGGSPEYGRQDDFKKLFDNDDAELKSHYVGKAYGVDAITNYKLNHRTGPFDAKDISNTEILSMGMELMVKTPVIFAKRDPEFFNLVHDVMRGKYTK